MKDIFLHRPKIDPKIIFECIDDIKNIRKALVIGGNNIDAFEVFKVKNIVMQEFKNSDETDIINYLNRLDEDQFDLIVLNAELCNFFRINEIINLLLEKGKYSLFRFRSTTKNRLKISKRNKIKKEIKKEHAIILKRYYVRFNRIHESVFFKIFSYYTVYLITRNNLVMNFELSPIDKLKKLFNLDKTLANLLINKK